MNDLMKMIKKTKGKLYPLGIPLRVSYISEIRITNPVNMESFKVPILKIRRFNPTTGRVIK